MQKHITLVAALHIGFSVLFLVMSLFLYFLLIGTGICIQDYTAASILTFIGTALAILLVLVSLPGLIGGIGLLHRKNWARILIIIVSCLDLINIPFGTAIGIYSLWVLLQEETEKIFRQETNAD
ncbi:MAG TPA: hypothetical protein ENG70_05830 [Candidatus Cloacimonetes bacterium]|nr:hypothetical protein [Candidatus Cloacimonadota bacterium]HEX38351.1 hypothetical protein [Candidatus Cloacimonadota bacterium]